MPLPKPLLSAIRGALILLALSAIAALATQRWHPRAPALYLQAEPLAEDETDLRAIRSRWRDDVLWIDARTRDTFEAGHIPGALLLNEFERDQLLIEHLPTLQDTQKPIVVYCGGESCQASRKMRDYLHDTLGLTNVWVLKGGWKAWQTAQGQ